jgi:hypothetical protein
MGEVSAYIVTYFLWFKGKGKVVPVLNWAPLHEDVLGSGSIVPFILWPWH